MTVSAARPYLSGPASPLRLAERLSPPARRAFETRVATLVATLSGATGLGLTDAVDVVATEVGREPDRLWLAHAVLAATLPSDEEMADLLVRGRLAGTWAALAPLVDSLAEAERFRAVDVLRDSVTCDVHTTSESEFLSGIQRVVRETTSRWHAEHDLTFVGWTSDLASLRPIHPASLTRLLGLSRTEPPRSDSAAPVVVPWEGTHLWVEVITDLRRTGRLRALAEYSGNRVGVLGYDSIPITSSTTVATGMTSHFARGVAAQRHANRVAMISEAAAQEFRGVVDMGAGRRDSGPEVAAVVLPVQAPGSTVEGIAEARAGLTVDDTTPMVLVVGSHEPRKNHLAVLHAAEVLWREGLRFNLVLAGAGSWHADEYTRVLDGLTAAARPVQSVRGLPDRLLWAAYRLAHCTLFPSLNEGFGLPVAESLAVGTPVITSEFGSMRDIVAPDGVPLGGLLVDPRDDQSIVTALRTMLTDEATYLRLRDETSQHRSRTWDDYADELWAFLVDGVQPLGTHTGDSVGSATSPQTAP